WWEKKYGKKAQSRAFADGDEGAASPAEGSADVEDGTGESRKRSLADVDESPEVTEPRKAANVALC
ncbi:MAG: hypothetical protein SGPRY_009123, partial [Prymnesium sp.]